MNKILIILLFLTIFDIFFTNAKLSLENLGSSEALLRSKRQFTGLKLTRPKRQFTGLKLTRPKRQFTGLKLTRPKRQF
ncbi:hypothetical protein Mgra_00008661, partial [Meloidogyne graminicola]